MKTFQLGNDPECNDSRPEECRWKRFHTASGENGNGPCPLYLQSARHLHGRI